MFVYDLTICHINFIQNKHAKLDETHQGTQVHFKANLSNVMEILGRMTSKLHETLENTS